MAVSGSFEPVGPTDVRRVTAPGPPPSVIETRFAGRLEFAGGFPTDATVQELYDRLDFQRGCELFLRHMMAAAIWGFHQAWDRDLGIAATELGIFHLDANGLVLTGNSETLYGVAVPDLKLDGPLVIEVPPRVLGLLNDQWMRPLGDLGIAGPDRGAGGRYLIVGPGQDADGAPGDFAGVIHSRTYRMWLVLRAFMGPGGDAAPGEATLPADADLSARSGREPAAGEPSRDLRPAVRHDPPDRRALLRRSRGNARLRARRRDQRGRERGAGADRDREGQAVRAR